MVISIKGKGTSNNYFASRFSEFFIDDENFCLTSYSLYLFLEQKELLEVPLSK